MPTSPHSLFADTRDEADALSRRGAVPLPRQRVCPVPNTRSRARALQSHASQIVLRAASAPGSIVLAGLSI
eukprot:6189789-Pleurochrysis_carterae.AAC.1